MIQTKSISSPLIQFLLYCVGAVFVIIAAFVLLRKSGERRTPIEVTITEDICLMHVDYVESLISGY